MAVRAERVASRHVELVTTAPAGDGRRRSVLDLRGGPLDGYTFGVEDRAPASWLIVELRNCCGSADGRDFVPDRGGWRSLSECSPALLERAVRKVERCFPGWSLPPGRDVFERIERFFGAAMR